MTPQARPLLQAAHLRYLGKFRAPAEIGTWAGASLGIGPNSSLYLSGTGGDGALARINIPAIGGTARILDPLTRVPNLLGIYPKDVNGIKLGGALVHEGRLVVGGYAFYDGSGSAEKSHWVSPDGTVGKLAGPYRVGQDRVAMVGGYMGTIPQEWQSILGGPCLTGKACTSIIWRSSAGPSASVFDPAHVGTVTPIPSKMLVGYPTEHQTLGTWEQVSPYYTGTQRVGGLAFPSGYRSLIFVSRRGETFCYGSGAECNDPSDGDKGTHGYPYTHVVTAWDANDLAQVAAGAKEPWQVMPYAQWKLPEMNSDGTADMISAVYDDTTRRLYVVPGFAQTVHVHVYEVAAADAGGPAPVDCAGAWSPWERVLGSEGPCVDEARSYRETSRFVVTTPAGPGGKACPASPVFRTLSEGCDLPIPTHKVTATVMTSTEASMPIGSTVTITGEEVT